MRTIICLAFLFFFSLFCFGSPEKILMSDPDEQPDHIEHFAPADMPDVYYDTDLQEIIICADGFSVYYDVDIISQSSMIAVISTQVDGYGDSIDISSLPDDNYTIVITSEFDNVYQGQFTNY